MIVVCLDLEGILMPEIWMNVAEAVGVEALNKTTRDIPDYDRLMRMRLQILRENGISFGEIQDIIRRIDPLPGAMELSRWIRYNYQLIILSDTFEEFFQPMQSKMEMPTIFCHALQIGDTGMIEDYRVRIRDHKRKTVASLKGLNYRVIAVGDSFNDLGMLREADAGILFRPSNALQPQFCDFPVTMEYGALKAEISKSAERFDRSGDR